MDERREVGLKEMETVAGGDCIYPYNSREEQEEAVRREIMRAKAAGNQTYGNVVKAMIQLNASMSNSKLSKQDVTRIAEEVYGLR